MNIEDITPADLAALKSNGYTEEDLSMLDHAEVKFLLPEVTAKAAPVADDVADTHDAIAAHGAANSKTGEIEADATGGKEAPFMPTYSAEVPADAEEQIKALRKEERDSFKALMDGEIDADEYQAVRDRTEAEADALKTKALTASIFQQANQQAAEQAAIADWNKAERAAFDAFKAEGLAYKEKPALLAAYNTNLRALGEDPKNAQKDAAWFLSEAHRLTKADLGIVTQQKNVQAKGRQVDIDELPPTLRSVPASATGAVNSDEFSHLRSLMETDPLGYEKAVAGLSDAQRDRWMSE